jgi:hypothetical protein
MWRRVRALPKGVQLIGLLVLLAGYTAVAVAIFSGGGGESGPDGPEPVARTDLERRIGAIVEAAGDRRAVAGDRVDFRKPRLRRVRCEGTALCEVHYAVGVPGNGRILEQQAPMVREALTAAKVTQLRMTVVRGGPRETGVPPKREEETRVDTPLLHTDCDRRTVTDEELARISVRLLLLRLCKVRQRGGAPSANPGKGAGGGGILETGRP